MHNTIFKSTILIVCTYFYMPKKIVRTGKWLKKLKLFNLTIITVQHKLLPSAVKSYILSFVKKNHQFKLKNCLIQYQVVVITIIIYIILVQFYKIKIKAGQLRVEALRSLGRITGLAILNLKALLNHLFW